MTDCWYTLPSGVVIDAERIESIGEISIAKTQVSFPLVMHSGATHYVREQIPGGDAGMDLLDTPDDVLLAYIADRSVIKRRVEATRSKLVSWLRSIAEPAQRTKGGPK